jgi:hypothetical protein
VVKIVGNYDGSQGKLLLRIYDNEGTILDASGLGDSGKSEKKTRIMEIGGSELVVARVTGAQYLRLEVQVFIGYLIDYTLTVSEYICEVLFLGNALCLNICRTEV